MEILSAQHYEYSLSVLISKLNFTAKGKIANYHALDLMRIDSKIVQIIAVIGR